MAGILDALKRVYENPGHEFNTGLGITAGVLKQALSGQMPSAPRLDASGRFHMTAPEGSPPMAMGDVLMTPPEGISERSLAHENVHQGQSKDLGFLYPLMSALGGRQGPLEYEALQKTRGVGDNPNDELADKLERMDLEQASNRPGLLNLLYRYYYSR